AYPQVPWSQIGIQHVANALAAYESSAFDFSDTPFDRYLDRDDAALSQAQKRGAQLYYGQARCAQCHRGGLLSDLDFHNIAAPQIGTARHQLDLGYYSQTFKAADRYKFRTPPLRNCALTPPYTHAGGLLTLDETLRHHLDPARSLREYDPSRLAKGLVCRTQEA